MPRTPRDRPPALPAANRGYGTPGAAAGHVSSSRRTGSSRRLWRPCGANPRYLGGIKPADADGGDRHGGAGTFIEVEAIAAKIALATRPPGNKTALARSDGDENAGTDRGDGAGQRS